MHNLLKGLKIAILVGLVISVVLVGMACAGPAPAPKPSPSPTPTPKPSPSPTPTPTKVTLRLQSSWTAVDARYKEVQKFIEQVQAESKGLLKFDLYPEGVVLQTKDMPTALPAGVIDMVTTRVDIGWPTLIPEAGIAGAMGLFLDFNHAQRFFKGEFGDILAKKLEGHKVKLLSVLYGGPLAAIPVAKKPIKLPEDVRGMKFRVGAAAEAAAVEALGGTAIILSAAEIYQAIQRGTIDGTFTSLAASSGLKLVEVAKYWTRLVYKEGFNFALMINLDVWNRLDTDQQKILIKAAKELDERVVKVCTEIEDKHWDYITTSPGVTGYVVPPKDAEKFMALIVPATKKFLAETIPAADLDRDMKLIEKAK